MLDIFAEESARAFVNAKKQELEMDRSTLKGCSMTCKNLECFENDVLLIEIRTRRLRLVLNVNGDVEKVSAR